jgi:[ribosomal protein S18]-alanine N-acetyltransferase
MGDDQRGEIGVVAVARVPQEGSIPEIELTRMRRRHLRRVLAIEGRVYPRPWTASLFLSELTQRNTRTYLVARYNGEVVGYAGMMFLGFEAHVTNIAIDPDFHGMKIGSRLLLTLITEAIARGSDRISLEVRVSNDIAQTMYNKFGFATESTRKGYYIETNEDAYFMVAQGAMTTGYRMRLQRIRNEIEDALRGENRA